MDPNTLPPLVAAMYHMDEGIRMFNRCSSTVSSCQQFKLGCSEVAKTLAVCTDLHFPYSGNVMRSMRDALSYTDAQNFDKNFQKKIRGLGKSVKEQAASVAMLPNVYRLVQADIDELRLDASTKVANMHAEAARKRDDSCRAYANAERKKAKFDDKAVEYYAEAQTYDAQIVRYEEDKNRYESAAIRYESAADEIKQSRQTKQTFAVGSLLEIGGIGVVFRAGTLAAAGPAVAVLGAVGMVAGAAVTLKGFHDDRIAQGFEKEARGESAMARTHQGRAIQKAVDCARSQTLAMENAERATENGQNALRHGNRIASQAMLEAQESDTAAELFNNDMKECLSRYSQAMREIRSRRQYISN